MSDFEQFRVFAKIIIFVIIVVCIAHQALYIYSLYKLQYGAESAKGSEDTNKGAFLRTLEHEIMPILIIMVVIIGTFGFTLVSFIISFLLYIGTFVSVVGRKKNNRVLRVLGSSTLVVATLSMLLVAIVDPYGAYYEE